MSPSALAVPRPRPIVEPQLIECMSTLPYVAFSKLGKLQPGLLNLWLSPVVNHPPIEVCSFSTTP